MKRRQNGEGTIYQRPNGLWICEITLGYDENGKRIKKTVSSMELDKLKKKLNDLRFYNDRNMVSEPSKITLYEWLNIWLETYKKNTVKPSTYDMYYNAIHTHIKPVLGNYKLDKVTPLAIQRFINDIYEKKNSSQSTLKKIVMTISQGYEKAISLNMLYQNPCRDIVIPSKDKRKAVAFTKNEQEEFVNQCSDNNTYNNLFVFALNTGLRMGELLALTWDDYNENEKTVAVNKNLSVVNDYTNPQDIKQKIIIDTTKTENSTRIVPLSSKAEEILNRQKTITGSFPFVFISSSGTPLEKRNIYKALKKRLNYAQVKSPITFHSLRHSFATRLLEKGADIKTLSELLGHKSIQITLDIYSHVGIDLKKKAIELLNN